MNVRLASASSADAPRSGEADVHRLHAGASPERRRFSLRSQRDVDRTIQIAREHQIPLRVVRGDRAYREFLSRVYWGYQEGEEGDPGEDEGFVGIIDATCANGG